MNVLKLLKVEITMKNILRSIALVCATITATLFTSYAIAAPIDVSYTVNGSANNWTYDFSVTNNLNAGSLYFFGVELKNPTTGRQSGDFDYGIWGTWTNAQIGGSDRIYTANWVDGKFLNMLAGGDTAHFVVSETSLSLQPQVNWFMFAIGANYTGPHFYNSTNPGIEGVAVLPVPEAETYAMLLGGLGLLGAIARRRKQS
jgi:hypothetical protein